MDAQSIKDFAQRNTPPYGDMLTPALAGKHPGAKVVILGNGPSASSYKRSKGDIVIACNNALKVCKDADYWLVTEGAAHVFDWFWDWTGYKGQVVWDRFIGNAAEQLLDKYGEAFLSRVIWIIRHGLTEDFDIRQYGEGLPYIEIQDQPAGTVLMHAIHLAGIMGAAEVHLYGAELHFAGGKQHACGWKPYGADDGIVGTVRFNLAVQPVEFEAGGKPLGAVDCLVPVEDEAGQFETTRLFLLAAAALTHFCYIVSSPEFTITDHSKGLLSPEQMLKAGE